MKNPIGTRSLGVASILVTLFFDSNSLADIEGVWRGLLMAAPDTELLVEFTIASAIASTNVSAGEDSYSVVLNTPESAAIKDVAATDVSFSDNTLILQVPELSGSFQGTLEESPEATVLVGTWSQLGDDLPLQLAPFEEAALSAEHIASIEGKWEGTISRGDTPIQAVIWRFETDETGTLTGFMGPAAQGVATIPMQNISITDSAFSFTVNDANGKYSGVISNGEVTGNWTQRDQEMSLNMTPRPEEPEPLNFSEELVASVVGDWSGTIIVNADQSQDVLWRFESTEAGKVTGLMGPAAQGVATIPMQNIVITEAELSFSVFDAAGEFTGTFSEDGIEGTWNQGQDLDITMTRKQ